MKYRFLKDVWYDLPGGGTEIHNAGEEVELNDWKKDHITQAIVTGLIEPVKESGDVKNRRT